MESLHFSVQRFSESIFWFVYPYFSSTALLSPYKYMSASNKKAIYTTHVSFFLSPPLSDINFTRLPCIFHSSSHFFHFPSHFSPLFFPFFTFFPPHIFGQSRKRGGEWVDVLSKTEEKSGQCFSKASTENRLKGTVSRDQKHFWSASMFKSVLSVCALMDFRNVLSTT